MKSGGGGDWTILSESFHAEIFVPVAAEQCTRSEWLQTWVNVGLLQTNAVGDVIARWGWIAKAGDLAWLWGFALRLLCV